MTSPSRPPFPEVIDSSLMSAFRACPQKCFREYFEHWKPSTPNVHLHAGKAYAEGLESSRKAFFLEGRPVSEAIETGLGTLIEAYGDFECPVESAKSLPRLMGAYEFYHSSYPMESDHAIPITLPDGKRGIEFSFAEPLDCLHPETGLPLLYVGRMDMVVDFAGATFGLDDKTTSSLGASWSRQWDLRSQFTAYTWGAGKAGIPLSGFLVRGVSILKTKFETQQAITYRPSWMIERWEENLLIDLERMKLMWEKNDWAYNLDESCNHYGGCPFRQVCLSRDPQPWLEGSFVRRKWDPVSREETLLD